MEVGEVGLRIDPEEVGGEQVDVREVEGRREAEDQENTRQLFFANFYQNISCVGHKSGTTGDDEGADSNEGRTLVDNGWKKRKKKKSVPPITAETSQTLL